MKAVLVLLLALLAFSSANLIDGRYRFSSEVASSSSRDSTIFLTSSVIIAAVASDDEAQWYNLFLEDLTINGKVSSPAFLPFQFSRFPDGQIGSIRAHPAETLELKNLKKGIAESFQTKISHSPRPQEVTEIGADGMRNVRYEVVYADSDKLDVRGAYTYGDFVSFPKESRMEEMPFEIIASKVTSMKPKGKVFQSSVAKTQIMSSQGGHHVEILATTRMEFETTEFAMIDMIFEADWVVETLVHDIEVAARVENLKASLPSVETLFTALLNNKLAGKELLLARGQLATLMNNDEESLSAGLQIILANLKEATREQYAFLASTLSRINAREAQRILAAEIEAAAQSGNNLKVVTLLKSLAALTQPEDPATLFSAVMKVNSHRQVNALVELTLGHLIKLLPTERAEEAIAFFTLLLAKATTDADKIHYLHVLGNAGQNAPVNIILSFLADPSLEVRAAVLTDVRYHLHLATTQQVVVAAMAQEANRRSRSVMSSLVASLKQNMKTNDIGENFKDFLAALAEIDPATEAAATLREFLAEKNISRKTSEIGILVESDIWNDTHPGYELVAPLSQRQQDVDRYPSYTAFLFSNQYGPDFANLKIAGGVFSGTGGDACLAGDFKIFDKLYTEIRAFRELTTLADLQLYVLTYENEFESRIYAIVNGNTLIDINLSSNCTEEEHIIFSGTIDIIVWDTEIPISIGNVFIYAYVYAGLELDGGYEICLLTLNPFVELWVTGEINMTVDSGVTITAVGIIRAGLEGDVYINYVIGPDTQLGSIVNNTSGEHVCKACIGVYYGYEEQNAYVGLFIQRREGLGWGDKTTIPLSEWVEPAVPFPTPLVEVCSDEAVEYTFHVLKENN